jgi:hypothetical protein
MRGLLLRLSKLDEGAESAVRIIAYFDGLTRNHASAEVLVRAAANLAECSAGMRDSNGTVIAFSNHSGAAPGDGPPTIIERSFGTTNLNGVVWLERLGEVEPLDDMVLERMAVAAEIVLERRIGVSGSKPEDAVLIRTMVNPRARGLDRLEAAKALGLQGDLTVVAISSERDLSRDRDLLNRLGRACAATVRGASIGEHLTTLLFASPVPVVVDAEDLEKELRDSEAAGIAAPVTVGDAPESWVKAQNALRFARTGHQRIVHSSELGALEVLAEVDPARAVNIGDVLALDRIQAGTGGQETLRTLRSICSTGSIRKTAAELRLHHSSVDARIRKAETVLGFSLDNLDGLFRLNLAIKLLDLNPKSASPAKA